MRSSRRSAQRGFTLIEMIVVVAILVILAGFILPKLDRVMLKSNKGVAAANMSGVSRYIQTYRIMHNVYPDGWDTLLNSGATVASHTLARPGVPGGAAGIDPQLGGGPPVGSPAKLIELDLTGEPIEASRSLARMGITQFYDWNSASTAIPGSRFLVPRDLVDDNGTPADPSDDDWEADAVLATLNCFSVVGPATDDDDANNIVDHIYPANKLPGGVSGTIPSGKLLVVLGFGPQNTAIGDVLQEAPTYANTDPTQYYNRNLAIFEVSDGGSRCELKAVVGGDADMIEEEVADFYEK